MTFGEHCTQKKGRHLIFKMRLFRFHHWVIFIKTIFLNKLWCQFDVCSYEKHKPIIDLPQTTAYLFFIHIISAYLKIIIMWLSTTLHIIHISFIILIFSLFLFVPSNHHHVISETYNFTTVNHIFFVVHLMTGFY